MIGFIEGEIFACEEKNILVKAGHIGYRIFVTHPETAQALIGTPIALYTHLAVRDDALDLYGFPTQDELAVFEKLLTVSGIGPKSALNILAVAGAETLVRAVRADDPSYLTKVAGIGKKTAEKIVRELKDKLGMHSGAFSEGSLSTEADALAALEALGYSGKDILPKLREIMQSETSTSEIVRRMLRDLGGSS